MIIITNNVNETIHLGKKLGEMLQTGDIVCLYGDLGSGKTAFSSGIGHAIGKLDSMPSPTFSIVHEYDTIPPLFHFDMYRISGEEDIFMMGFEEYLERNGVMLIEWADRIEENLPSDVIKVKFTTPQNADLREIRLIGTGDRSLKLIDELSRGLNLENLSD